MRNIFKTLIVGAMLAASSTLAYAGPLTGTLTIDGGFQSINPSTLNSGTTQIAFTTNDEYTLGGSGSFSSITFSNVVFASMFTFTVGQPISGGEVLLTFSFNGQPDAFTVTSVTTGANGALYFYGTLSDGTLASFVITPDISGDGGFSGTLNVPPIGATPEPSSLILLGTGLVGAATMALRRRRTVAQLAA